MAAEHKIHEQLDEITQLHEMLNGANARIAQLEGLLRQSLAAGTSSLGMDERAGTQGGSDKDQAEAPPPEKKVKVEPGSLVVFSGPPSSANQSTTSDAHLSPSTGPLVSWTQIVKDGWPGTITSFQASQKKRIDDSVKEFLTEKGLSQSQISQCVVFEGLKVQKPVAAVPVNYIEEFTSWFTRKIDEGMLHLSNLRRKGGKGAVWILNLLII